jgi:hypothetical protein
VAALAVSALSSSTLLSAPASAVGALPRKLDPEILADYSSGRAIVGFTHDVRPATIRRLADAGITAAVRIETIDAVGVIGSLDSYKEIATWRDVRYVDADSPLRWNNYAAKKDTRVTDVRKGVRPLNRKYTVRA